MIPAPFSYALQLGFLSRAASFFRHFYTLPTGEQFLIRVHFTSVQNNVG